MNHERVQWDQIRKSDIFFSPVTKGKIPIEHREKIWRRPNTGFEKEYASQNQLHRHMYSQIAQLSTLVDPQKSACFIQLPTNAKQARNEVERHGPLPPRTGECPLGARPCRSQQTRKVPACSLRQNVNRNIEAGPRNSYPKISAYAKTLRKRK